MRMRKWFYAVLLLLCIFTINNTVQASATKTTDSSKFVIVLDPGHGGSDPGALRIHSGVTYFERDIVLKIAKYCKEELEKYPGVEVYLTRSTNGSTLMDRKQRTQFALEKKADVIVSLHINSTGETYTSVSGALVYCPYTNTESGAESQALAKVILEKIAKVGLKNRGILVDEGLGMIKYPKENKVPGILVEHGFINNPNDVSNYLNTDAKLKKLGIADAEGIIEFYNLKEGYTGKEEKPENNTGENTGGTTGENTEGTTGGTTGGNPGENTGGTTGGTTGGNPGENTGGTTGGTTGETTGEDFIALTAAIKEDGKEYILYTDGVSDAYALSYAIRKQGAAEETTAWKAAKKNTEGQWESSFVISDYKKKGTYQIEAYTINQDQTKLKVASAEIIVNGPAAEQIVAQNVDSNTGTFEVKISGLTSETSMKKVTVKVSTQEDMSNAKIYQTVLQEDGSYIATANVKYHKNYYGTYYFYVYARDTNEILKRFTKKSIEIKAPDLHMKAFPNKAQTKYTVSLDKRSDITAVKFAVWSKKNGQNDLRWYDAKVNKKGRWSASVKIANHKSSGTYYVDAYGINKKGDEILLASKTFKIKAPSIKKVTISKSNIKTGKFRVNIKGITAEAEIEKVTVRAWTKDGQSDGHIYQTVLQKNGNYQAKIDIKKHDKNYGIYKLKIYVKDKRGVMKTKQLTHEFLN